MKTLKTLWKTLALTGLSLFTTNALAANPEPVSVNVTFVDAITITEVSPLEFGLLNGSMANGQSVTVDSAGGLTDTNSNVLGGAPAAAEVTVTATAGKAINILVDNISNGTHYTLSAPVCNYNGAGEASCVNQSATSVASAALYIGMTLTRNGTAMTTGVDNGSFDVNVTYN